MPFDPSWPFYKAKNDSAKWREQLTSLKALIDDQAQSLASQATVIAGMQAQIDALMPAPFIAVGFAEALANGGLKPVGFMPPPYDTTAPVYRTAGGWFVSFDAPGGCWLMTPADPRLTDQTGWHYRSAGLDITGQWLVRPGVGIAPAGTVTANP
jgi:hypothetical protein